MNKKLILMSFCTVATLLTITLFKKKQYLLLPTQKASRIPKDAILIGEGIRILPVVIYDK